MELGEAPGLYRTKGQAWGNSSTGKGKGTFPACPPPGLEKAAVSTPSHTCSQNPSQTQTLVPGRVQASRLCRAIRLPQGPLSGRARSSAGTWGGWVGPAAVRELGGMLNRRSVGKNSYSPYSVGLRQMATNAGSHRSTLVPVSYKPNPWLKVGGSQGCNPRAGLCLFLSLPLLWGCDGSLGLREQNRAAEFNPPLQRGTRSLPSCMAATAVKAP